MHHENWLGLPIRIDIATGEQKAPHGDTPESIDELRRIAASAMRLSRVPPALQPSDAWMTGFGGPLRRTDEYRNLDGRPLYEVRYGWA